MNYFPFHLGDYAAHTAHLEPMEDLAYRRLLDQYYLREGPLPADLQATAKLIRMRSMISDVESVLKEFFDLTEAGWIHVRCETEIAKMKDKQAKARGAAEQSVKSRRAAAELALIQKQADAERTLQKEQTDVELPTPTPTPEVNNKRAPRFDAQAHLVESGIPPELASDWIKLRKTKKAEVTKTAIEGIEREALKAGISLDAALRECCTRGWAGLKASWLTQEGQPARSSTVVSIEARNKAVAAAWVPPEMRGQA